MQLWLPVQKFAKSWITSWSREPPHLNNNSYHHHQCFFGSMYSHGTPSTGQMSHTNPQNMGWLKIDFAVRTPILMESKVRCCDQRTAEKVEATSLGYTQPPPTNTHTSRRTVTS